MSLLVVNALLILFGLAPVTLVGLVLTAVQCPEFVGRRPQARPVAVVRRWQVA